MGEPAANKVHNLQAVPILQASIGPLRAGNYVSVMLERPPVALESQVSNQILEMGRDRQLRKLPRLTVEDKVHTGRVSPGHSSRPQQPPPHAAQRRLHLGSGIIDSTVESLQNLDGRDARVGASQRSLIGKVICIFVGEVFNRVSQDFERVATFRGKPAAYKRPRLNWPGQAEIGIAVCGPTRVIRGWGATKIEHDSTSWRSYRPKGK